MGVGGQTPAGSIGDPPGMLDLFGILLPTLATLFHERHDLVVENLLLRHQRQVALRSRPRPHLNSRDRFFWLVVRRSLPPGSRIWRNDENLVRAPDIENNGRIRLCG